MKEPPAHPVPLKDRCDQPDLVERIAGQAARDLPEPPQLSPSTLARIAMRIEERASKPRALHFGRVLVAASVLLGIVTVASAARMDLMPRWIAKMVGMESKPKRAESSLRPGKARNTVKKVEAPVVPVREPERAQPEMAPAPEKTLERPGSVVVPPTPGIPAEAVAPRRMLAREEGTEERRGLEDGPTTVGHGHGHGHVYDHDHNHVYDHDHGRGLGHGDSLGVSAEARPTRLAMKSAPGSTAVMPGAQAAPALVTPPVPLPIVAGTQTSPASPIDPARPAPPAASAPVQPTPAPVAAGPTRSPAAGHLKEVVRALRVDHTPRSALERLDRYAPELVGTAFAEEALLLRVEAMLALKQQPEALRLLDGTSLANAASSSVLLLTRGQLRANANRCAEALGDFDLILARTHRPPKQALLGRAQCKQKLGDSKGAQADLDRLHREFPAEPAP